MSAIQTIKKSVAVFDELSNLIANPPADRAIAGAVGNGGRRLCDAYGNLGLGAQLLTGPGRPILNLLCEQYFDGQGFDGPVEEVPFTGGQCDDVTYQINRDDYRADDTFITVFQGNVTGPISELTITRISSSQAEQTIVAKNGTFVSIVAYNIVFVRSEFRVNLFGGGSDTCGDPPGTLVPGPNPPPDPGPFPPGEEPGVDPTGQPFFFIPDITQPGFEPVQLDDEPLGGAPELQPNAAGGDGLPGDGDAIGDEAGEVNGGDDGEDIDFGDPPEGKIWIGCIIETTSVANLGGIPGTGPQSKVWPTVRANAALNYGSKKGTNNRINSQFHDIIRSATSLVVTGVFLQVQPGSTSKVFPLSALKCPENPCEE